MRFRESAVVPPSRDLIHLRLAVGGRFGHLETGDGKQGIPVLEVEEDVYVKDGPVLAKEKVLSQVAGIQLAPIERVAGVGAMVYDISIMRQETPE